MANFQVNRNALQAAVNRNTKTNTSKKSKVDKNKEKLMRQQEQASRKSQQPIYNITPTPLNVQQSRNNLEAARKAQAMSKNNLDSFLNRGGVSTNAVDRTKRIIAGNVIKPENKKITPISEAKGSKNIYNTITPANASQALHIEQQKRQELMDTDEGTMLSNSYRNASNTVAYEKYNYNQKLLEGQNKFNIADKTVGSLIRGVTSLFDNMDAENFVTDENGNRRKLASYSEMKQQKLQQSQSLPGRLVSSTLNNLGRILGSTAIDTATLGVGGKAIYWGDTFFDTYNQNLNEGYDEGDSATSAFLTTALGAVIDKMIGSAAVNAVGNVEAKGLEDIISSALTKKGVSNTLANYLSSMSSEGISEFIEEYADAYINKFTLDKSTDPADYINLIVETFPAALEAGAVGSLSGAVGSVNEQIQDKRTVASLNKYITTLENFEPSSPQEANMKEEALSDALQQRDELQQKWGTNEKNTEEAPKKQTFAEMEQEATEALEKRKQEQAQNQTASNRTEQVETKPQQQEKVISSEQNNKETKTNYNIPEAKNADKIVAKITENATPEVKKQTEQLFAEPSKNKTTVKLNKEQTVTTPSETTREGGLEAASKYIKDSVPQKEVKEIQREDKKRRKSLDNLYNKALNMGDTERAAYIKELADNDLYTVEHSGYEVFKETMTMLEDPETYYKQYSDKINTTDKLSTKDITKLEYMQTALYKYYADYNSPSYNPTMANSIIQDWAEEGTTVGQALAARRQMYNDDPNHVAIRTQQTLNSLFREEAKNHEGDIDWLNKNDPMKNSDSPYHMSDTQLATVNYYANKLGKMEDKTSTEYLTTYSQLDNYIQSLFGDKKLTEKMKRLTITNVLASTRIWAQNIKGNFVNLAQFNGVDRLVATSVDKIISNQTQMRSTGMSFEGDREFIKGYKQGVADSWTELTKDITLSKFHSKFTDSQSTDMGELGKKGFGKTFNDNTAVGKALNKYQNIVNFALDIGDRPFAQGYYAQSIHNQRMLNAQIDAQASGKNTVYYTSINNKTKMYEVRYFDSDGKKVNTFMTEDQYKTFAKTAVEEELTEQMCNIAEKEALENTYQDDNKITKAALKMKDSLNNIFHIGDFGFGDMILKFTRTGSNMAKSLYEHSPLAAAQLVKDSRALNRNIKAGTATIEMQHKVAREAGKVIGGTITMSVIGALDWAGLIDIEGEHDDDKEDKFKESTMGSQEYSVELPGGEYNYKISSDSTIGSLAKLGKTAEELAKDGNNILEVLANMTAPFTNEIIDNSFMSSILDLGSSYSDPLDNLARKIASQPSNLIPSFIKDYSIARDNYAQRTTYDENLGQYMINQIINKTPLRGSDIDLDTPIGKIKGLSSKKTAWGEIRTVGGDFLASAWNTWLTGDTLSRIKNDTISNEVIRVYTETNNTDSIPNLNTTKNFSYNNKKYDLSEKEQDKYMTTYGKTSYNAVRDLMKTNQYKNATDEQKVKLLDKAYEYAKEKAIQQYVESKGKTYYNFKKDSKTKKYTEYKKSVFEEIIENDISIEEASYKRKYNNSYKLKTSITGLENYQDIAKNIKEIKKAYSKDNGFDYKVQKYVVQTYINELQGMSSVQKAMLSKLEHSKSDYANYDDKILSYIKSLDLTDEEYQYMYKELGLGGYWAMYYKTKKNKN